MERLELFADWIFFHVLLAFLPIIAKLAVIITSKKKLEKWYQVIQDGELYIYSTTLSAWSITSILFQKLDSNNLVTGLLIVNLVISSLLFGITSHSKWVKQELESLELDLYARVSIVCSFIAVFCTYISGIK